MSDVGRLLIGIYVPDHQFFSFSNTLCNIFLFRRHILGGVAARTTLLFRAGHSVTLANPVRAPS